MPSVSGKQARLMAMAAHDPKAAKRVGVPQAVAKEFNQADKGSPLLKEKGADRAATRYGKKGK